MSDNVQDLTLPVLMRIHDELAGMRSEMREGFARLDGRIDETNRGVDQTNARLDHLIETVGGAVRGEADRLTKLEKRVDKLERGAARTRRPTTTRRR